MSRCPECWSNVEPDARRCSQCDARIDAPGERRGVSWRILLGTLAFASAAVTGTVLWYGRSDDQREEANEARGDAVTVTATETDEDRQGTDLPADAGPERPPTQPPARSVAHVWTLETDEVDTTMGAILVATPHDRTGMLVPLAELPPSGGLWSGGSPVPVEVVTTDSHLAYALLVSDRQPPADKVPLVLAAVESIRDVSRGQGGLRSTEADVRRVTPLADGTWNLDVALDAGVALLTEEGNEIVALTIGGTRAAPLQGLHAWIARRIGEPLESVQRRRNLDDPDWLLLEVDRILGLAAPTEEDLRTAIDHADRAVTLATGRGSIDAASDRQRLGRLLLARTLARSDPEGALAAARDGHARFPNDPATTSVLVQLLAFHGDPFEAADLFVGLRVGSPDHASGAAAETLADGLSAYATRIARARPAEATRALLRAVELFPDRAALHMELARLLDAQGDRVGAASRAREAAALDPAFAAEAGEMTRRPNPGEVVIRFPPGSSSIDTTVSVAGTQVGYVIDTGATLTTLPTAVADRLGIRSPTNRRIRINTASGEAEGELAKVAWLEIGDSIRVPDVEVVVIDLPQALGGRGLLGMNVLGRLDMRVDGRAGRLVLKAR